MLPCSLAAVQAMNHGASHSRINRRAVLTSELSAPCFEEAPPVTVVEGSVPRTKMEQDHAEWF